MTDQARDALSVALENLRRGDEELRRASETASRLAGQAAHKPGGIKLDGPEWARIQGANEMEHHLMNEQKERERAVGAALLEATTARRGAPWRPTSAVNDIMAYASERSATHGAIGLTPQFRLAGAHEFRAAVMSTSSYPEETWRAPGFEPFPTTPITQAAMIDWVPTDFDNAQYMAETTETNTAAETSEGVAAPEVSVNFVPTTTYVKRIPATLPATRQVLDDAAVLEDVLTNRLLFMVKRRLEDQMIAGNGTLGAPDPGANLTGILSTPGVLTVTKATFNSFLQPQLDSISAAIEAIQAATYTLYSPNVLLLHPSDALQLRDLKTTEGKPVFPPNEPLTPGGLVTIITSAAVLGTPIVGATSSLSGFIRGDVLVAVSQSHADLFVRNEVQLYVELRAAFAVRQPMAWCLIEGFDS